METHMKPLKELFTFDAARSNGVSDYAPGPIPFVTSKEQNNGVVSYITPEEEDRVFVGPAIAISGLGYASIHTGSFLPKGNGGDSLTILTPKQPMIVEQLIGVVAAFNTLHKWRFSFGRKCNITRLEDLEIPIDPPTVLDEWSNEKQRIQDIIANVESKLSHRDT
ncbi:MAG: hypothetical protein JWQ98_656 [Chlorobi bacterium]|nr:hypothetical protein [Chlorobiota bacterium]